MPTTVKIKGIILKISDTPGKDRLLHILTDSSFITAFVTPKRSAGKKSYTFDLFTYGEFVLYVTGSGNYLVNSITPLNSFYGLRNDIACLSAAGYFAELAKYVSSDADCDYKCLMSLVLEAFGRLADGCDIKTIKPVFEFKAAQLLGFTPCLEAEKKAQVYCFDLNDGRLHINNIHAGIMISRKAVYDIYRILSASPADAYECILAENCEIIYNLAQQYIIYHTERDFASLRFLNGVI